MYLDEFEFIDKKVFGTGLNTNGSEIILIDMGKMSHESTCNC